MSTDEKNAWERQRLINPKNKISIVRTDIGRVTLVLYKHEIPRGWRFLTNEEYKSQEKEVKKLFGNYYIVGMVDGRVFAPPYTYKVEKNGGVELPEVMIKGQLDCEFKASHKHMDIPDSLESVAIMKKT